MSQKLTFSQKDILCYALPSELLDIPHLSYIILAIAPENLRDRLKDPKGFQKIPIEGDFSGFSDTLSIQNLMKTFRVLARVILFRQLLKGFPVFFRTINFLDFIP
ncbi:MAG TPA: hypothetical protein VI451_09370 [Anaerolineales bacterium]|nr:hypothetical protein [Anaerolineales bacterium]